MSFSHVYIFILVTDHCTTPTVSQKKTTPLPEHTPVPPDIMIYRTSWVEKQSYTLYKIHRCFAVSFDIVNYFFLIGNLNIVNLICTLDKEIIHT